MLKNGIPLRLLALAGIAAVAGPMSAQADFSLVLQDVGTGASTTYSQQAGTLTPNSSGGVVVPVSVGSFSGYFTGNFNSTDSALEFGGLNISNTGSTGTSDTLRIYWSENNLSAAGLSGGSVGISQSGGGSVVETTGSMTLSTYVDPTNSAGLPGAASYSGTAGASFSNSSTSPQSFTLSGVSQANLPLSSTGSFALGELLNITLSGGGTFAQTNGQFTMNGASTFGAGSVNTPEPASLVFVGIGGMTLLLRKRKKKASAGRL